MSSKSNLGKLLPILFGFFVMGFVDIVNLSTSYVKQDFALSDTLSNMLPMMVFIWFAILSIPTGYLMNSIGRKKTVLLSSVITAVAMLLPLASYTFPMILIAFALLGIGNTILQVSLNPLLMNVVAPDRITSSLTLGQLIKAICSFLGPVLVAFAASSFGDWKLIFPLYAAATILSLVWLLLTPITEQIIPRGERPKSDSSILALLKNRTILLYFTVIIMLVGFEIGLMTVLPKYLLEKIGMPLTESGFALSIYYIARTAGAFAGAIILAKVSNRRFFVVSMLLAVVAMIGIMGFGNVWGIYASVFVIGAAASNIFAIAFGLAMQHKPESSNQISSLMITGVAGGALIPPIMGVVADASNQSMSLLVPLICLGYILSVALITSKR